MQTGILIQQFLSASHKEPQTPPRVPYNCLEQSNMGKDKFLQADTDQQLTQLGDAAFEKDGKW